MEQWSRSNDAAAKDVKTMPEKEESVGGTGQTALQMKSLLLLDLNLTRLPPR